MLKKRRWRGMLEVVEEVEDEERNVVCGEIGRWTRLLTISVVSCFHCTGSKLLDFFGGEGVRGGHRCGALRMCVELRRS